MPDRRKISFVFGLLGSLFGSVIFFLCVFYFLYFDKLIIALFFVFLTIVFAFLIAKIIDERFNK
jgi:drug/metabolite transporter (DMT)-like permease